MDRALFGATVVGSVVSAAMAQYLSVGWFLSLGAGALYLAWTYFAVSYPAALWIDLSSFDRRTDRLGYGVGVFGCCLTPLAIGEAVTGGGVALAPVVAAFGLLGFPHTLVGVRAAQS